MRVPHAHGTLHPEQTIRAVLHYPMNAGRMIPEILPLVDALRPSESEARVADDNVKLTDWYPATRPGAPS
ncbi:hypothetical protein ACIRU8_40275 [Streptomyces sp. NPDC101175]|uniref:hypothetical protein n=1 Tax=Streptomyces sp. NPDC101175 TaxID=3366123 RepID=UPI0038376945